MATTFHVLNFKNRTLNYISGTVTATNPVQYVQAWNGAQPADPSVTPAGATEFPTPNNGPALNGKMSAAGGGLSTLTTNAAPGVPANAVAVSGLTFARIFDTGVNPIIDTTATLVNGGGGIILDSLTSPVGVGNTVTAFSLKMPSGLNTLLLSQALVNRLVDLWCTAATVTPQFGSNVGGTSAITLYSGAIPASADAAAGTVLATYNMTATQLWGAAAGSGMSLAAAGPAVTASATGTATYFRMTKTLGAVILVFQGTVGTLSGASDMILNTVALTSGVTSVQITDFTISI